MCRITESTFLFPLEGLGVRDWEDVLARLVGLRGHGPRWERRQGDVFFVEQQMKSWCWRLGVACVSERFRSCSSSVFSDSTSAVLGQRAVHSAGLSR